MGDRPDKLVKDLVAARSRVRVAPLPAPPGAPGSNYTAGGQPAPTNAAKPTGAGQGVVPVAATGGPAGPRPAPDARKAEAVRLVQEGDRLAAQGEYGKARAKYVEADARGATFGTGETSPALALQRLSARGADAVTRRSPRRRPRPPAGTTRRPRPC